MDSCCGSGSTSSAKMDCSAGCTPIRVCSDGTKYVEKQLASPPKKAVICCEGGCIKGEIARVAANNLAYKLERKNAVRICLGDAATGDSGFVKLLTRAPEVIAIEGCPLHCGTEIIRKRIQDFSPTIVDASCLYSFDRSKYFEIFDMDRSEIEDHGQKVAGLIQLMHFIEKMEG